jgi:hypothetical protein
LTGSTRLALLEDAPRNATVVADTDMELVVLGQREFAGLLDEVPGFTCKMLAGTAHRLREEQTPAPSSSARKLGVAHGQARLVDRFFAGCPTFLATFFTGRFFAALTVRARTRAFVVTSGRRRVLALAFPRFAALTVALLVPAFFVAVRFGAPDRLTDDLVLVLAGFLATTWLFEAAVRFRFDDFEARLAWPVRART